MVSACHGLEFQQKISGTFFVKRSGAISFYIYIDIFIFLPVHLIASGQQRLEL